MENFKKEIFFKEYNTHISCQPLSNSEKLFFIGFLQEQFGENYENNSDFFKGISLKLSNTKDYTSINTSLELVKVFEDLAFINDSEVFVIWNYPSDMDKFDLSYLLKYWEDIWFGVSDEAVAIFLPVTNRIIVITHFNVVYY